MGQLFSSNKVTDKRSYSRDIDQLEKKFKEQLVLSSKKNLQAQEEIAKVQSNFEQCTINSHTPYYYHPTTSITPMCSLVLNKPNYSEIVVKTTLTLDTVTEFKEERQPGVYQHSSNNQDVGSQHNNTNIPASSMDDESIQADFIQHILNWDIDQLDKPLPILIGSQPLPSKYSSKQEYYSRFLNLILEETRASLYSEMLRSYLEIDHALTEEIGTIIDLDPIYKGIILNEPVKYFKRIFIPGDDGACAITAIYAITGSNVIGAEARAKAAQELIQNIENPVIRNLVKSEVMAALLDDNELSYLRAIGFPLNQDAIILIQDYKKARKTSIDEGDRLKVKYFSHDSLPISINGGEESYAKLFIEGELDNHCSVTMEEKTKLLKLREQVTLATISLNQLVESKIIDYINHIVAQSGFWLGVAGSSSGIMGALAQIYRINFRVFSVNGTKDIVTSAEELTVICQHISDPDGLINNIYLHAEVGDTLGVQRASWHFDLLQEISPPLQKSVLSSDNMVIDDIEQKIPTLVSNTIQNEEKPKIKTLKLIFAKFKQAKKDQNPSNITFTVVNRSEIGNIQNNDVFILEDPSGSIKLISLSCYAFDPNKIKLKVIIKKDFFHINKGFFNPKIVWKATNIGSIVSNLRIYEVCIEQPEVAWLKQIYTGEITNIDLQLNDPTIEQLNININTNERQRLIIKKFLTLQEGIQLTQGPPGTGKTTLLVNLLKHLVCQGRVLVCAPSNKAVQVLAIRLVENYPEIPAILVANIEKLSKDNLNLSKIFLGTWHTLKLASILEIKRCLGYNYFFICKTAPLNDEIIPQTIYLFLEQAEQDSNLKYICKDNVSGEIQTILIPEQALDAYLELKEILQGVQDLKTELPNKYLSDFYKFTSKNGHTKPINLEKTMQDYFDLIAEIKKYDLDFIKKIPFEITKVNQTYPETLLKNLNFLEYNLKNKVAIETQLLNKSLIIFATLNIVGRNLFKKIQSINSLIIDEAGQSVEAETLIPFAMKPKKFLLIGDTKQLPATVLSKRAIELNFSRSLMLRLLEECKQPYEMLTEQYRMIPEISRWPSSQYYEGRLVDSESVKNVSKYMLPFLGSYVFINIKGQETFEQCSYQNYQEAVFLEIIFKFLNSSFTLDSNAQIGVITFYRAQVALLKSKGIKAQTVDGFQGDEKDFIIISFVRANQKGSIGFVKDFRRLNVALTRAKYSLIMLGNAQTLEKVYNKDVAMLIRDAKERGCFFEQKLVAQMLQLNTKLKLLPNPNKDKYFTNLSSQQQEQLSPRTQKMFSSINSVKIEKFEKIVANVPNVNCCNVGKKGDTALMTILRSKKLREGKEISKIQILIKYGASWTIKNKIGETAEDLVKSHNPHLISRLNSFFLESAQLHTNIPIATTSLSVNTSGVINLEESTKFLRHIGFGEQDEAEVMLKANPSLSLNIGDLIDSAGRDFKKITGFQYAVWALDWHMWEMLRKYMSTETIKKQLIGLKAGNWVKAHGTRASWQNLIDELQKYVDRYKTWTNEQRKIHWCQQVGGKQLLLPAHVGSVYNQSSRLFDPCPDFLDLRRSVSCRKNGGGFKGGVSGSRAIRRNEAMIMLLKVRTKQQSQLILEFRLHEELTDIMTQQQFDYQVLPKKLMLSELPTVPGLRHPLILSELEHTVKNMGYDWYDVGGGGNCLFLSIAHQLNTRNIDTIDHIAVRNKIADYINSYWDEYKEFITDQDLIRAGLAENKTARSLTEEEKLQYIAKLKDPGNSKKDGYWGDHVSIKAAAAVFKVNVIIKSQLGHDITESLFGNEKTIYIGHIAELHYQSLFLKEEVSEKKIIKNEGIPKVPGIIHHLEKIQEADVNVPTKSVEKQLITNSGDNDSKKGGLAIYLALHNVPPSEPTLSNNTVLVSSAIVTTPQCLVKFLKHIGFGEQDKAEAMLKEHRDLALASGDLIDCAGRNFKQITGFQYAVWALDWHMWEMLRKYMSTEAIKEQLIGLKAGNWVKDHDTRASWQNLIDALQIYIDNYNSWTDIECRSYWAQKIGGEQLILPAHVIQEYCRPDKPPHRSQKFDMLLVRIDINERKNWFENNKGEMLGRDFGRVRGYTTKKNGNHRSIPVKDVKINEYWINGIKHDIKLLETLLKIRLQQRTNFICNPSNVTEYFAHKKVNSLISKPNIIEDEPIKSDTPQLSPLLFSYGHQQFQPTPGIIHHLEKFPEAEGNVSTKSIEKQLITNSGDIGGKKGGLAIYLDMHKVLPSKPTLPNNTALFSSAIVTTPQCLAKFLKHIGFGEQDEAEAMLKENRELALASGNLIDCAGRQFKQISGFQYAIWALDYHMWTMIKKYLNIENMRAQVAELNTGSWIRTHGSQINLNPLIEVLDVYVKNYANWDRTKRKNHWCQQVAGAQLILPAHVINEYSHPSRSFYPCPKWGNEEVALPRTGVADWRIASDYKLGSGFAWKRAAGNEKERVKAVSRAYGDGDLAAISELLKSRTEQSLALISELTLRPAAKPRPF